ncbi:MAG: hypothetical protein ACE5R6_12900 [Candidatus Heimdallarchaeota archaeon]
MRRPVGSVGAISLTNYSRFAKFFTRLNPSLVEEISVDVTRKVIRRLRVPCKILGVDSTSSRAYANSFSKKGDPDATVGKSSVKGFFFSTGTSSIWWWMAKPTSQWPLKSRRGMCMMAIVSCR